MLSVEQSYQLMHKMGTKCGNIAIILACKEITVNKPMMYSLMFLDLGATLNIEHLLGALHTLLI